MRGAHASVGRLSLQSRKQQDTSRGRHSLDGAVGPLEHWPASRDAYAIAHTCGQGGSGTVHLAYCREAQRYVAVKAVNLEALANDSVLQEVAVMRSYCSPSILPLYTSFVAGQELWMVMPYCEGGSVAHVMKYRAKDGLCEAVIATIAREVLLALDYIHRRDGIHRDVKAGNILLTEEGRVLLGDFGVAATMERGGDWGGSGLVTRNTFVGTPCWMAPEVLMQAGHGPASDIWSLGITLLEMAYGDAPFARYPPMKVLMMTLQGPPPQLEEKRGCRQFSKAMRQVVALCLQKDAAARPTAKQLLQHKFFKQAKDAAWLRRELLDGLPPLPQRVSEIRLGSARAATRDSENVRREAASKASYISSVAHWDFQGLEQASDLATESDLGSRGPISCGTADGTPAAGSVATTLASAGAGASEVGANGHGDPSGSTAASATITSTSSGAGGAAAAAPASPQAAGASESGAAGASPPVGAKKIGRFSLVEGTARYTGPSLATYSDPLPEASESAAAPDGEGCAAAICTAASAPVPLDGDGTAGDERPRLLLRGSWRRRALKLLPWLPKTAKQQPADAAPARGQEAKGVLAQEQPQAQPQPQPQPRPQPQPQPQPQRPSTVMLLRQPSICRTRSGGSITSGGQGRLVSSSVSRLAKASAAGAAALPVRAAVAPGEQGPQGADGAADSAASTGSEEPGNSSSTPSGASSSGSGGSSSGPGVATAVASTPFTADAAPVGGYDQCAAERAPPERQLSRQMSAGRRLCRQRSQRRGRFRVVVNA